MPAMENVALWHERDISHSSVERMIGPDATVTLDFALARLTGVIDKLLVYPDNMLKNMNKFRGLVHSQRVLLALTQAGVSREDAYRLVQRNAMKVWEEGADFLEELLADPEVTRGAARSRNPRKVRSRLSHQACRHDLPQGVRRSLTGTAPFAARLLRVKHRTATCLTRIRCLTTLQENTGNRIAWFASGFAAAALLCGILLYSDGYFGRQQFGRHRRCPRHHHRRQVAERSTPAHAIASSARRAGHGPDDRSPWILPL